MHPLSSFLKSTFALYTRRTYSFVDFLVRITTPNCKHLVIDAGHISIESDLVDKSAVQWVQLKRNQQYNDEDYRQLESLMYDKLTLRLEDAQVTFFFQLVERKLNGMCFQFVLGDSLFACLDALSSTSNDSLHLLERINIHLDIHQSIVPTAVNLARFKIAGNLPSLHVNISDSKYKALMRLIDTCMPSFSDNGQDLNPSMTRSQIHLPTFQMPVNLFGSTSPDLDIDIEDQERDEHDDSGSVHSDAFFEAEETLQAVNTLTLSNILKRFF